MSIVATEPANGQVESQVPDDPPLMASGLLDAYRAWWQAVTQVHSVLELEGAPTDQITLTMETERRTRREYAAMLRSASRHVPDYLGDDRAFPPLWPTPEPPVGPSPVS
jgi:hypothetical protein